MVRPLLETQAVPLAWQAVDAVVIAGDGFTIDDSRARAQAGERIDDQREAVGEVVTRTAVEPHPRAVLARNDAEAVVLDLMQPLAA